MRILYLGNDAASVFSTRGTRLATRQEVALDGAGLTWLESWMHSAPDAVTQVIVDVAELEVRLDSVPHLRGSDRDAVLARKLAQAFRATPYRHAEVLGRESEGRRDDRVLLAGITNADVLRPYLDALRRHQVPVAGCSAAPLLAAPLAGQFAGGATQSLLVMLMPGGGLRQNYFHAGELRFTRFTRRVAGDASDPSEWVRTEITRTWQYLEGQRAFAVDDALTVTVIASAGLHAGLTAALVSSAALRFQVLAAEDALTQMGVALGQPAGADALLAQVQLGQGRRNHFATAEDLRNHRYRALRYGLAAASVLVGGAALAWAGQNLMRAAELDDRAAAKLADSHRLEAETRAIRGRISASVTSATMRDTVLFHQRYLARQPLPSDFLTPVATALGAQPQVRLWQVVWQPTDDAGRVLDLSRGRDTLAPVSNASLDTARRTVGDDEADASRSARPAANPRDLPLDARQLEVALIQARVVTGALDVRAARDIAEAFAARISQAPGYRASVVQPPLDVSPRAPIEGRLEDVPLTHDYEFAVRVVRGQLPPRS
jgi:hypothetical protein